MNKKEIINNIIWFIGIVIFVVLIRTFLFSPVIVSGHSMDPTLQDRERVIALKTAKINRFDIVTFPAPDVEKTNYIKRVIGLPGDEVTYKDDQLYINGEPYDEPYLDEFKSQLPQGALLTPDFSYKVPEDTYFVMGDNRLHSKDSRMVGPIDIEAISGNVKFSFWPPSKFGTIK